MSEDFDTLIRQRIPEGPYVLFWCSSEGTTLPNGEEDASGYAMAPGEKVWFWWTGWDAEQQRVVFTIWDCVSVQSLGAKHSREYQDAVAELEEATADHPADAGGR